MLYNDRHIKITTNDQLKNEMIIFLSLSNITIKNRWSFGYIINSTGGELLFTYYEFNQTKGQQFKTELYLDWSLDLSILLQHLSKDKCVESFLQVANQYGGVKSFFEFQPNFKQLKQLLN